jgi:hypothetical protein
MSADDNTSEHNDEEKTPVSKTTSALTYKRFSTQILSTSDTCAYANVQHADQTHLMSCNVQPVQQTVDVPSPDDDDDRDTEGLLEAQNHDNLESIGVQTSPVSLLSSSQ